MKAAVVERPGVVSCCEVDIPKVAPDEVLVLVAFCGICGSDVPRVWQGTAHSYPIILGHEFSGTVIDVGDEVDASIRGKRVAGIPLVPCGSCDACGRGEYSLCRSYSFVGSRRPGAFAEYVSVPVNNIQTIDDSTGFLQASFFEPATVALHAIDLVDIQPGKTALVAGCGTIGIFIAQALRAKGIDHVVATGRRKVRLDAAREAGVKCVIDASERCWSTDLLKDDFRHGFDYIFDTSGDAGSMVQSFELAANKATICMVGTPKNDMRFSVRQWENLNRKELTIKGSWMSYGPTWPGSAWQEVSVMFSEGSLKVVDAMIDKVYSIDECAEAFSRFNQTAGVSGKILISCTEA